MNSLVMTLLEDKRFLCVWLLYYVSNFADSRWNGGAKISILLHEIIFFSQCIQQQLGKNASIRSKLPTAACWSREEER